MKRIHNKKFIFWLIGLGCGMILSGVLMIVLSFYVSPYPKDTNDHVSDQTQQQIIEQLNAIQSKLPSAVDDTSKADTNKDDINKDDTTIQLAQEATTTATIIYIPKNVTAYYICVVLQQEGIISDAKDFAEYIKQQKKTASLKSGEIRVPFNASYEELLDLLIIKK